MGETIQGVRKSSDETSAVASLGEDKMAVPAAYTCSRYNRGGSGSGSGSGSNLLKLPLWRRQSQLER